jgi:hypothetical protein
LILFLILTYAPMGARLLILLFAAFSRRMAHGVFSLFFLCFFLEADP